MKKTKLTTVIINDILLYIVEANRYKNVLTAEEIIKRFPHAIKSFKYVKGELKITLHKLPNKPLLKDIIK
jgi:hypothetical protein